MCTAPLILLYFTIISSMFAFIKLFHRRVDPQFRSVTKLSTSSLVMGEENRSLRLFSYTVCFLLSSYVSFTQQGKTYS